MWDNMARLQQYQSNFSLGAIDPLLRGRIDLQQYYSALETAKNVLIEPQGGFSRRAGLKFVTDLTFVEVIYTFVKWCQKFALYKFGFLKILHWNPMDKSSQGNLL